MADKEIVGIDNFSFFVEKFSNGTLKNYNVEKLSHLLHFGYFS